MVSVKYLTKGRMEFFADDSDAVVLSDKGVMKTLPKIYNFTDLEFIEMIGSIIYSQTGDFRFTSEVIAEAAFRLGVEEYLLDDADEVCDYFVRRVRECGRGA